MLGLDLPGPLDILLDPISLTALGIYAALIAWEALFPARPLPQIRGWRLRGLAAFACFFYLSSYLPLLWDGWLSQYQLFDLTAIGTAAGALGAVLVYEAGVYFWHRTMHGNATLWRVFHQMHHSAERLDTFGAFWFSPADMVGWTLLGSLTMVGVVGITPESATIAILTTFFLGTFQHANVRTPRWLGVFIQRPESHSVHHQRGVHRFNYSDLPIFDILFGTFRNPTQFADLQGFYNGASARVLEMIAFRDVGEPDRATAAVSAATTAATARAVPGAGAATE